MKGILGSAFLACVVSVSSGCCSPPMPDHYWDPTRDALETLRGFVYAIETENWGYAYDRLTRHSRELHVGNRQWASVKFPGLKLARVPHSDLSMHDAIVRCVRNRGELKQSENRANIRVVSVSETQALELRVFFLWEEGEWRFDLDATLNYLQGIGAPADLTRTPQVGAAGQTVEG